MSYYVGLDLGQRAEYTALAVVEEVIRRLPTGREETHLHLRHLQRFPLRTPYSKSVDAVALGSPAVGLASAHRWGTFLTGSRPRRQ